MPSSSLRDQLSIAIKAAFVALTLVSVSIHAQEKRLEQMLSLDSWRHSDNAKQRRDAFVKVVKRLSDPGLQGRSPGTEGGRQTVTYLAEQFTAAGLTPAGDNDSFYQRVSLTRYKTQAEIYHYPNGNEAAGKTLDPEQYIAWSSQQVQTQAFNGQALFVGYGVQAPEYQWDDYAGLNVQGRIVVMLTGDPPTTEPGRFDGPALTRHGRWDHKLKVAAELGAGSVILIHDAKAAGYPFSAVRNTFGQERLNLTDPNNARREPPVVIWASAQGARELLTNGDEGLEALAQAALTMPKADSGSRLTFALESTINISAQTEWESFDSYNVVGQLESTTPAVQGNATIAGNATTASSAAPVALVGHWDHLGQVLDRNTGEVTGYYPGAADNASGLAQLLDICNALKGVTPRQRPLLVAAFTAEESGLLGARHFVRSLSADSVPARPQAAINLDIANVFGRARDIEVIGLGLSGLDSLLRNVARENQRRVSADYAPQIGRLFRSDQYEFVRAGIPALWIRGGREGRTFSLQNPLRRIKQYLREGYHQPGDTLRDWWSLDAALEDANLIAAFAARLINTHDLPGFPAGSPYRGSASGR